MAVLETILPALGQLAGQAGQIVAGSNLNRKTRAWNEKMYGVQRSDALADWNMQNEYNSPTSQMARLRDAGLNPNLVYGNGITQSSPTIRSASVEKWNPENVMAGTGAVVGDSLMRYFDVRMREAQTDNLKAQNTVIAQDALLKAAQTAATLEAIPQRQADTQSKLFDLDMKNTLRNNSLEMAHESLRKLRADTDYTLNQDERAAAQNHMSIVKAAEEVLSIRLGRAKTQSEINLIKQQMANVKADTQLKGLDIQLKQMGIMPGDPMWSRILGRLIGDPNQIRPITREDFKPSSIPDSTKDQLNIPYKSGWQKFKESRR